MVLITNSFYVFKKLYLPEIRVSYVWMKGPYRPCYSVTCTFLDCFSTYWDYRISRPCCCCLCLWRETTSLNCGHHRTYCSSPGDVWVWKAIDRGNLKNSERSLSKCHFIHHKCRMAWPGNEASAARGRRLTAWAKARPKQALIMHLINCRPCLVEMDLE
jgi:hypothetical protein